VAAEALVFRVAPRADLIACGGDLAPLPRQQRLAALDAPAQRARLGRREAKAAIKLALLASAKCATGPFGTVLRTKISKYSNEISIGRCTATARKLEPANFLVVSSLQCASTPPPPPGRPSLNKHFSFQ
jgi:hypothetical protein